MLHRSLFWVALTATSALLVAGCKTTGTRADNVESEAALEQRARAHAHYAAGVIHDLNDESVLALKEYYEAAKADPGDQQLVLEASRRFLLNKQPEKALELLARAVKEPNASGEVYGRLGFVYSQLGQLDMALNAGLTAIKKSPQSLAGYQNLYLTYFQNKQPDKALAALDEAAKVPDTDAEFLTALGELYVNFGMQTPNQRTAANEKAHAIFIRAQRLNPPDVDAQLKLAEGFNLVGDTQRTAEMYRQLLPQLTNASAFGDGIRARLADIYLKQEDHQRAFEQLEAILQNDPANAQVNYYLGSLALDDKQPAKAADYFSKTILLKPDFEPAYYDLASAQINLDQSAKALATLEQARQKFQQSFLLEYLSGVAHSQQKNYTEALTNFTAAEIVAEVKEPQRLTSGFYFQVGSNFERVGDIATAEKYLQKSLDLQPNNDEAMNYLGYMWADHGTNLNRARELIEKALKADPKSAAYLDSMGWVLFKLGQPGPALDYVLKSVAASEEPDAELLDHLGDIYAALNQMDKAQDAWRKSVAAGPNERVQKKLEAAGKK